MNLPEIRTILMAILILSYNVAAFEYVDTLLENRRIKKSMLWCVYALNLGILLFIYFSSIRHTTLIYFLVIILMFIEFHLIYKESTLSLLFITLALSIHIIIFRAVTIGLFAIVLNLGLYDVNQGNYATDTMNISLAFLTLACILVKILIPARSIKIIQQHKEQLIFMTTWLIFLNAYFLFSSLVFTGWDVLIFVKYNVVAVSVAMIFVTYIVLLYTIKVGTLLNYKEKSDFLESVVEEEKQYKNSIIDQAILGFEANLTKDSIVSAFGKYYDEKYHNSVSYTDMSINKLSMFVHEEDVEQFLKFTSIENLLDSYGDGVVDLSLDFRSKGPNLEEYLWFKISYNLYKATSTDNVMAFSFLKNIDAEKKFQLDIKNRSERDSLTGLYNHGMIKKLVDSFITEQESPPYKGFLIIIDIDNFKMINDNLGHTFGDKVLNEISSKLLSVFRCDNSVNSIRKEDDIVGRLGGDEFMVFVKTADIEGIRKRAKRMCEILKTTYTTPDGLNITISASIGIAATKSKEDTFEDLYSKADTALYISKRKGKNCYSFYEDQCFKGYKGER